MSGKGSLKDSEIIDEFRDVWSGRAVALVCFWLDVTAVLPHWGVTTVRYGTYCCAIFDAAEIWAIELEILVPYSAPTFMDSPCAPPLHARPVSEP
jgi:hypothetical protein